MVQIQRTVLNFKRREMKKAIFIILIALAGRNPVNAQMKYDTCQYVHQFEGEWRYANGLDTIRVYLRVNRSYYPQLNNTVDELFGWHEFKQGNTIVESTYPNRFMSLTNPDTISKNSVSIGLRMRSGDDCNPTFKTAYGSITDYLQARETKIVTVTLDASGTVMTWRQRHSEGYGVFTGATGMTLPKEFVLIKQ